MRRAALLGVLLGLLASRGEERLLERGLAWRRLAREAPRSALYLKAAATLPFPLAMALAVSAIGRFLAIHGVRRGPRPRRRLPSYPFDPGILQLVIGERHSQDGSRLEEPGWLVLPERGLLAGILVTGATGSGKTTSGHHPFTAQLIRIHAGDQARKLGGLVLDAKGNYAEFVRRQCVAAGREADYYEISLESGVRYNVLSRRDLDAAALAGHLSLLLENTGGRGIEPFWEREAQDLAAQCIRVIRLAKQAEPTLADLYRVATSPEAFEAWFREAERRATTPEARGELESVRFWLDAKFKGLDPRLRASIAAGLNGLCAVFDVPRIREVFCPEEKDEDFRGFDRLIAEGSIVAVRLPEGRLKTVAQIVGVLTKLNFFDAVLNRLAACEETGAGPGRAVFFVADEYDVFLSQPSDGVFFSKCREARCVSILATQSYESIEARLRNPHLAGHLLANLRTKVWLCAEDNLTARQAADLCGEVERQKTSRSRNATSRTAYSLLDGKLLATDGDQVGESSTVSPHREHLFPPRVFTTLGLHQAIVKAFDGEQALPPWCVYLKAIHEDPRISWFEGRREASGILGLKVGR
jgi:hypothetical protein